MCDSISSTEVSNYTWRDDWVFPYESLWSLTNKFGALNWIPCHEIKRFFKKVEQKRPKLNKDRIPKWNYSLALGLDFEKIRRTLNLSKSTIDNALTTTFIPRSKVSLMAEVKELRFCAICIRYGYHSVFHQLKNVSVCPIHKRDLIQRCPSCMRHISYDLQDHKNAYACNSCSESLLTRRTLELYDSEELRQIMGSRKQLYEIFDWFATLPKDIEYPEPRIDRYEEMINYWAEVFNDKKTPECFNSFRASDICHTQIPIGRALSDRIVRLRTPTNCDEYDYLNKRELKSIYKSIRRYFVKLFNTRGMKCISKKRECIDSTICDLAIAFHFWRREWENETRGNKNVWAISILKRDLGSGPMNLRAARRIFAFLCYWDFQRRKPFWTIAKSNEQFVFHSLTEKYHSMNTLEETIGQNVCRLKYPREAVLV